MYQPTVRTFMPLKSSIFVALLLESMPISSPVLPQKKGTNPYWP